MWLCAQHSVPIPAACPGSPAANPLFPTAREGWMSFQPVQDDTMPFPLIKAKRRAGLSTQIPQCSSLSSQCSSQPPGQHTEPSMQHPAPFPAAPDLPMQLLSRFPALCSQTSPTSAPWSQPSLPGERSSLPTAGCAGHIHGLESLPYVPRMGACLPVHMLSQLTSCFSCFISQTWCQSP